MIWERDDYLRGRIKPLQQNVSAGPTLANFNSLGLRGPEPQPAPARVVCLGDSVTFGWGVSDQAAYPAVLAQSLGPGVDVVNSGMPRWNSCDLLDLYVTRLIPLQPRVLVVMAGWDDVVYELPVASPDYATEHPLLTAAGESFGFGRVIGAVVRRFEQSHRPQEVLRDRETAPDSVHWERLDEYERIMTSLVQLAQANGSQPVLVTLPHFLRPELTESEKRTLLPQLLARPDLSYGAWRRMVTGVNARIRKVAAAHTVPLADCANAVPSRDFLDLCHLNEEGNRALAACVAPVVAPLVPGGQAAVLR